MRDARLSRRVMLGWAALGLWLVGGRATSAAAQQKVARAEAKYQDQPKGQQRCEICVNFQPPSSCQFVEGPIRPKGWCLFFAGKENAR